MIRQFHFERTFNYAQVKDILTAPRVYEAGKDDFCAAREDFEPLEGEAVWYVLAYDGEELLGLFALAPQNTVCWELHTALLAGKWIPQGKEALRVFLAWAWERIPAMRIVAAVPQKFRTMEANQVAIAFLRDNGFKAYGRNPLSFQRRGRLVDQVLMGIGRPTLPSS